MQTCSYCGKANDDGVFNCSGCGTEIEAGSRAKHESRAPQQDTRVGRRLSIVVAAGTFVVLSLLNGVPRTMHLAGSTSLGVVRKGFPLTFEETVVGTSPSWLGGGKGAYASKAGTAIQSDGTRWAFTDGQASHFYGDVVLQNVVIAAAIAVGAGLLVEIRRRRALKQQAHEVDEKNEVDA
jgi:hypothetical protein